MLSFIFSSFQKWRISTFCTYLIGFFKSDFEALRFLLSVIFWQKKTPYELGGIVLLVLPQKTVLILAANIDCFLCFLTCHLIIFNTDLYSHQATFWLSWCSPCETVTLSITFMGADCN